jgi:hypothetical protein
MLPFRTLQSGLILLLLLSVLVAALPVYAAGNNPCADARVAERIRYVQQQTPTPVLYDGVQALRRTPKVPAVLPADVGPACVLLSAVLVRQGGEYFVQDAGQVITVGMMQGGNRTRAMMAANKAATQVLREIINQDVLPVAPKGDGRYLIAIPLAWDHPWYQRAPSSAGDSRAASAATGLADRGWPEAQLLSNADGVSVYLLAQRDHQVYFAILRAVKADQPLIDFEESTRGGIDIFTYGPETTRRFRERIQPLIRPNVYPSMQVEVWHYAKDVHLARQQDTNFGNAQRRHPLTGSDSIEVPAAVETWEALRRNSTQPLQWSAGSPFYGVGRPYLNTLAEIRAVQDKRTDDLKQQAQYRAARDAREQAERDAKASREATLERERARVYPAKALVYRAPGYWQNYKLATELRAVFDGDFPDARRHWEFAQIYRRVIRNYSRRCDALIPRGSPELRITEIEYDKSLGISRTLSEEVIRIRAAWAKPYEWWDRNTPEALPLFPGPLNVQTAEELAGMGGAYFSNPGAALTEQMGSVMLTARVLLALRDDMPLLFDEGCSNPVLTQLQENMRRMALGLPSLQAERAPQLLRDWKQLPQGLNQACQRYIKEGGFSVGRDWCPCLEGVFHNRTSVGERWRILDDYTRFFRTVDTPPEGGPNDPAWALYQPANACRR